MIWVGWRQQRTETLIAAAALALLAAVAIPIGVHMASVYTHDGLSACSSNGRLQPRSACGIDVPAFLSRFNVLNILFTFATLLPPLAALLLAAPFVLDLDSGTYRLFWTQSITRRRWIVTKLGMSVACVVLVVVLLSVLASWSLGPIAHFNGRMGSNTYDAEGIVPIAYALFTLGVAVALGALWRRTVPALLSAFALYVVARAFVDSWLRQHLVSTVTATWQVGGAARSNGPQLDHALVINQFLSDKSGHALQGAQGLCVRSSGALLHTRVVGACSPAQLHGYMTAVYIPASRFWHLQAVEFGLVAGIGAALILAAGWWTHRRIA
jgi:hypothetical protein